MFDTKGMEYYLKMDREMEFASIQSQPPSKSKSILSNSGLKKNLRQIPFNREERDKTGQELIMTVEETKKWISDDIQTLNECYEIMKGLREEFGPTNAKITRKNKIAQDMVYEAKCYVTIGDEDPRDANPLYSIKVFKQFLKEKKKLLL